MKKILIIVIVSMILLPLFAANEIQFPYHSADDPNLCGVISKTTNNNVYDVCNAAWANWLNADEPNYDLPLTLAHKDYYYATFPAGITTAGIYPVNIYLRGGTE